MADFTNLETLRSEIAAVLNQSEQYCPLVYRVLKQQALKQGWQEDRSRGNGDHRLFLQEGYKPITVDCPGEGSELAPNVAREKLRAIYQPAADQILRASLSSALNTQIDRLIQSFDTAIQEISAMRDEMIQTCVQELDAFATQKREAVEQQAWQTLNEDLQAVEELVREQMHRKQQEMVGETIAAAQQSEDLAESLQVISSLEAQLKGLQQENSALSATICDVESQYHQIRTEFAQFTHQQKRKDLAALLSLGGVLILGLLGIRSFAFPEEPLLSISSPIEQSIPRSMPAVFPPK